MVSLSLGLTKLAEHELFRRDIRGNVLDVHFVVVNYRIVVNYCPMLVITFTTHTTPTPVLWGEERMEHHDDKYYLYLPIDTQIEIK